MGRSFCVVFPAACCTGAVGPPGIFLSEVGGSVPLGAVWPRNFDQQRVLSSGMFCQLKYFILPLLLIVVVQNDT